MDPGSVQPDSALARVVVIVTIRCGERETCLLQVMFYRSVQKAREQKWFSNHITPRFHHIYYGTPNQQWVALYPLLTLRAPALSIADPAHTHCSVLCTAQYMSRGLWEATPIEQSALVWHPAL